MPRGHGLAVKKRVRANGQVTKSDPTLAEPFCNLPDLRSRATPAGLPSFSASRLQDRCVVHGDPAPGVDPGQWRRRWSSEAHGPERTIISADPATSAHVDGAPAPENSKLDEGQNLAAAADMCAQPSCRGRCATLT